MKQENIEKHYLKIQYDVKYKIIQISLEWDKSI